jgi:hypothetical protein
MTKIYIGDMNRVTPCTWRCNIIASFESCRSGSCPGYIDGRCRLPVGMGDDYYDLFREVYSVTEEQLENLYGI